jgi:hypothetical protein
MVAKFGWCKWDDSIRRFLYEESIEKGVGFAWLKLSPSARGKALGDAYLSVVSDPTAIWWNPGALPKTKNMAINFTHTHHFMGIRHEFLGLCVKRGENSYGFAFGGIFINGLEYRDTQPMDEPMEEFSAYAFSTTISYARCLEKGLNLGISFKLIHERIYIYELASWLSDFGLTYSPYHNLWLGFSFVNLGPYPKFEKQRIKPPRGWKIGVSYEKFGLLFSVGANKYIDAIFQPNIGIEYNFNSLFSLRGGYSFWTDTYSFSLGFGIKWRKIEIDYAFRPYQLGLGNAHIFTITKN